MSALLPVSEHVYELNLCAEHGYTYRDFKRSVRVYQSTDYESAMFLIYVSYKNTLPNRRTPYRNHFTLYRNSDTVIVVRSETTLRFQDHDAALQYDVIKPTESYRASTPCDWTVSFDKIEYSQKRPSFITYNLVCSGEWWYFENGVILNGVTAYEKDTACGTMFVYYELHPKYNIVTTPSARDDARSRLLTIASTSSSLPSFMTGRRHNTSLNVNVAPAPTHDTATSTTAPRSPIDDTVDASAVSVVATGTTGTVTTSVGCNPRTQLCSFLANPTPTTNHVIQATTLNSSIAPIVNTLARPIIRVNDEQEVPDPNTKNVVPSLFWFTQRSKELNAKSIAYFLPKDFKISPDFGGVSFLNGVYYNMGLPAVPLPRLDVVSSDK